MQNEIFKDLKEKKKLRLKVQRLTFKGNTVKAVLFPNAELYPL